MDSEPAWAIGLFLNGTNKHAAGGIFVTACLYINMSSIDDKTLTKEMIMTDPIAEIIEDEEREQMLLEIEPDEKNYEYHRTFKREARDYKIMMASLESIQMDQPVFVECEDLDDYERQQSAFGGTEPPVDMFDMRTRIVF